MPKEKAMKGEELVAYKDAVTRKWVEHELDKCKLESALRLLVGHATDKALASPEAAAVYQHQFDDRRLLGKARQTRKAWASVVRQVIASLESMSPKE